METELGEISALQKDLTGGLFDGCDDELEEGGVAAWTRLASFKQDISCETMQFEVEAQKLSKSVKTLRGTLQHLTEMEEKLNDPSDASGYILDLKADFDHYLRQKVRVKQLSETGAADVALMKNKKVYRATNDLERRTSALIHRESEWLRNNLASFTRI